MRVPGALLLAAALALVADAANPGEGDASRQLGGSGPRGKTTYLFETMATGDSIVVAEHGPITLTAVCRSEVEIDVSIEATVDDYIYVQGLIFKAKPLLAGETFAAEGLYSVERAGNNIDQGGVLTGSGYYVGWDGESMMGLQKNVASKLEAYGEDVNCVLAGSLKLIRNN